MSIFKEILKLFQCFVSGMCERLK